MWNGFSMISKRPELTDGMMQTLVAAECALLDSPGNTSHRGGSTQSELQWTSITLMWSFDTFACASSSTENEYSVDDRCLILLLKGLCLKNQGQTQAAEQCFNKVYARWTNVLFIHFGGKPFAAHAEQSSGKKILKISLSSAISQFFTCIWLQLKMKDYNFKKGSRTCHKKIFQSLTALYFQWMYWRYNVCTEMMKYPPFELYSEYLHGSEG